MNRNYSLVIIFLLVLAVGGGIYVASNKSQDLQNSPLPTLAVSATVVPAVEPTGAGASEAVTMENGLKIEDEISGTGVEATAGKNVTVHYTGTLTDGTKFDSSLDRGVPFTFKLGSGEVIAGWDQGVAGMKVGGKRKLTIPPSLGYGAGGAGNVIPPNATLIFEIELLKVE